jgi:hypothetical protein
MTPKIWSSAAGTNSGKKRGPGPTTFIVAFSRNTETPSALISGDRRPAWRSGRYATRSIETPRAATRVMHSRKTAMSTGIAMARERGSVIAIPASMNTPIIAPSMNRSPWAKLMS